MYVNPVLAAQRNSNPDNLVIKHRNTKATFKERTPEERLFLGVLAKIDTPANVQKAFAISRNTVGNYAKGVLNVREGVNQELKEAVDTRAADKTKTINESALTTLQAALGLLDAKLPGVAKATDVSKIAKDMAFVADKMSIKSLDGPVGLRVIINSVTVGKVNDYEMVEG